MSENKITIRPLPLTPDEIAAVKNSPVVSAPLTHVLDLLKAVEQSPDLAALPGLQEWVHKYADAFITKAQALISPPFEIKEVFDLLGTLIEAARELPFEGLQKHQVVSAIAKHLIHTYVTPRLGFFAFLLSDGVIDSLVQFVFKGR